MPADIKIDDFFKHEALYIQNGFACGDWNDAHRGIIQLRPFNVSENGEIDLSATKFVEVERDLRAYLLKANDVIFNNTNSEELVGKTALWAKGQKAVLSNHMTIVRVLKEDLLSPQFVAFYLLKKWMDGYFHQVCRRHVNQASISIERLKDTPFPDFEISEQRRIAHVLTAVQTAIEQQARLIALTRELKSALMRKLFTEGLRGEKQKETEIGLVPESWEAVELACLLEKTEQVNLRIEGKRQIKYIDVSSISREYLRVETTTGYLLKDAPGRARKKVRRGDVIFATVRPTLLRVAYIGEELNDQVCSTAFCVLRAKKDVSNIYIYYVVQREQFIKQLATIESGASYPAVTDRQVKNQKIPKPKFDEQSEIAEILDTCDKKAFQHAMNKEKLEELFRTLLHQLMTGQVRVNELEL